MKRATAPIPLLVPSSTKRVMSALSSIVPTKNIGFCSHSLKMDSSVAIRLFTW